MLEQISLHLPKIKQLRLGENTYFTTDGQPPGSRLLMFDIVMPHSEIDVIIFEERIDEREYKYLKIFALDNETYYYYKLKSKARKYKAVSKEDYKNNRKRRRHMYICCRNKPDIRVGSGYHLL